ncbi:MAG: CBS domain-containing protein [Nodosilinea sp.]
MDLILCHTTADFDTLGAAVGLSRLQPGARIVLTGGCHPTVQRFVALHRDEYALIEGRAVAPEGLRSLSLVDAQRPERFGPGAEWIALAQARQIPISLWDHHGTVAEAVATQHRHVEPVGAVTTLVVEALRQKNLSLTAFEATVMALGIHSDTGSLVFAQTTGRDAEALAWLLHQGASLATIAEFVEPGLSPDLQGWLGTAMDALETETVGGHTLAWVQLGMADYTPGLSALAERLMALTGVDVLLLGATYRARGVLKLVLIGRARGRVGPLGEAVGEADQGIDWGAIFTPLGGGGHPTAAAVTLTTDDPTEVIQDVLTQAKSRLPALPVARDLMSAPVRTIRPDTTIGEAQRILLRYGHAGLAVVDAEQRLVGMISRRDIDLALHHGFSHAPVKGYMATSLQTIAPDTPLNTIEQLMVTYDIGRLPVLEGESLTGIVTRTDVLRHRHRSPDQAATALAAASAPSLPLDWSQILNANLRPALREVLAHMAAAAQARGWHLYLVGGAVRDLLLTQGQSLADLPDLDLVVDGFDQATQPGAGGELGATVKASFPEVDLQTHGQFQTAALVWHRDLDHPLAGVMIDIATARTEFYPYPAANPEVEASSIRQDLYRRDFTINAMALRLTTPGAGDLLDYFGGRLDLHQRTIRVLHPNSFIEDPTRIYRAVRFAVRLGFTLEAQTEGYIHHAISSGIYTQMQRQVQQVPALQGRLKNELKYILQGSDWQPALALLDQLQALRCIHSDLAMTPHLWRQLGRVSRWLDRFSWAQSCRPWQLRLEVLLGAMPAAARQDIATALQLTDGSIQRLSQLDAVEHQWLAVVATDPRPSQLYQLFYRADVETLLLVATRHPRNLGPPIWAYLTQWANLTPLVDGDYLKTLGYPPGPNFRPMLETALAAQLDGAIQTQPEARKFLAEHYPLGVVNTKSESYSPDSQPVKP